MKTPPYLDALQEELREDCPGVILTNVITICEVYDPDQSQRMVITMGSSADGEPLSPWLASGLMEVALRTGITLPGSFLDVAEDDEAE